MTVYQPGDHEAELLLGQCYIELLKSEDLARLFVDPPSLRSFLNTFTPPICLLFEHDERGIFLLAWIEPSLKGAFFALWLRQDRRKSLGAYRGILMALCAGLSRFTVLLGITGQESLVAQHLKLGYDLLNKINGLYGPDRPGWLMQVNREKIHTRVRRHAGWSDSEREFFADLITGFWSG